MTQDRPKGHIPKSDILTRLLYRDALMLVIDKPAGLPVHPDAKGGETLADHLDALRFGLPRRPELAHRLDRDTSGCLVLGRHRKALERLSRLFAENKVAKTYWAVVVGGPEADTGEIMLTLSPRDPAQGWRMQVDPAGLPALTRWQVLGRGEGLTWLALEPVTGRTHQLRVHCASMGWPILGDRIYGRGGAGQGLHLHARAVTVPLYPKRDPITVEAPAPAGMQETLAMLERSGGHQSG
jgi:tRNA pseudouridine32 synthase/23S rRNA pseudouridine746 synthase